MRIASSAVSMMVGSISRARPRRRPAAKSRPSDQTTVPKANTPARIDGKPVSTLAAKRTTEAVLPFGAELGQEDAARMPNGTLMTAAMPHHHQRAEDGVADAAADHAGGGRQFGEQGEAEPRPPRHISMISTETSGTTASTVRTPDSTLMPKLNSDRGVRSDFSSCLQVDRATGAARMRDCLTHLTTPLAGREAELLPSRRMISSPITLTDQRDSQQHQGGVHQHADFDRRGRFGKLVGQQAASVLAGENSDRLMTLALPTSMASAIVSPRARPKPRTIEP